VDRPPLPAHPASQTGVKVKCTSLHWEKMQHEIQSGNETIMGSLRKNVGEKVLKNNSNSEYFCTTKIYLKLENLS